MAEQQVGYVDWEDWGLELVMERGKLRKLLFVEKGKAAEALEPEIAKACQQLLAYLNAGDVLLVAELSRLGRNMFEVIDIINQLGENGVEVVFVRQPELSTTGSHRKLLLAIYSYFAETEREFISLRTRQGLAAARAKGKNLGRPRGSRDKYRVLDPYRTTIREHLRMRVPLRRIWQIVNPQLAKPISYNAYRYFVRQDPELLALWEAHRG